MSLRSTLGSFALSFALAATAAAQVASPFLYVPRARLTGADTARFGTNLALSGDDLLVSGRTWSQTLVSHQYVFHRNGASWTQEARFDVEIFNTPFCMGPPSPLAIEGDLLAIGSPMVPLPFGSVWTSRRTGSTWSAPVDAEDDRQDYYYLGQSVVLHEGAVISGEPNDVFPGDFVVFQDSPAGWQLQADFTGGDQHLGAEMAISGDTLAVADESAVNVYTEGASVLDWGLQARLDPAGDAIVQALALDGDTLVVSTQGSSSSCPTTSPPGVYVYRRTGTDWEPYGAIPSPDGDPGEFGLALAVSGDQIYVGASTAAGNHVGAVHVFRRLGPRWAAVSRLAPSPALPADSNFGAALGLSSGTLAVGAPGIQSDPGEVQVFDAVELPPPQTYCTAKVNSQGCLPAVGLTGIPSATSADSFLVRAANVINNKTGILLYSRAGAASNPYMGGIRCVASPFRRINAGSSHGNPPPNDCSGSYAVDFNARIRSGIDPGLQPGVQVWVQFVTRDPADPFTLGLTDAATFVIGS